MSTLRQTMEEYLRIRRALGFKLENAGRLLPQFLDYLESLDAETITIEHALRWATLPSDANPVWWGVRLTAVRGFARYLQAIDPRAEIPPRAVLPIGTGRRRPTPYIYSEEEITALMTAAGRWRPRLSAATMHTLIGLLTVTGMRIGEAIRLDRDDLDLEHGRLMIYNSKFGKSRQLPLHPTSIRALHRYLRRRDELHPHVDTHALLITATGKRLDRNNVERQFRQLRTRATLAARPGSRPPRLHDLRHTFAVHTMLDSYRVGGNPVARVAQLATYLGHADPAASYWYLSATPDLLALAATRLEADLLEARR